MAYIGNTPFTAAFLVDTFSGNGSTVAFTMSVAPANTSSILVSITGVVQDPSTYSVSGTTLTFSAAPPSGTSNISVRYLGIPASGVTTTAYRTQTEFTATAGQTTFTVPSYTVGFIDVYRNGLLLGSADFTATTGTTVVLANAASAGDFIETVSFFVSSVLNALPQTGGTLSGNLAIQGAETLTGAVATNGASFSGASLVAGRVDSSNEGGQVDLCRASDNASAWAIDVFGNTSTPTLRFVDNIAAAARMVIDGSGNVGVGTTSPSGTNGAGYASRLTLAGTNTALNIKSASNTDFYLGATGGSLVFYDNLNSAERARIDSSGNFMVGTTTAYGKLTINGTGGSGGQPLHIRGWGYGIAAAAVWRTDVTWSGNADIMYFDCRGTNAGSIVFTNSGTTVAYTSASDYRLKENVQPLADGLDRVMRLKPVTYTWIQGGDSGEGFIAHELQEVCPQAVNGEKDAVNQDGSVKAQSVDTSFLVATLTAAIQELKTIVDAQSAEIAALKGQA